MADQEDKKKGNELTDAVNELADTKAGVVFLTWLKNRCFFERSTIVGNPDTFEINAVGTISQEAQRRLYLDIRRLLRPELRKRIEQ